ncbi:rubredoxin [Mycetohabitans sp. B46]
MGWIGNEANGLPDEGIAPGTHCAHIPAHWRSWYPYGPRDPGDYLAAGSTAMLRVRSFAQATGLRGVDDGAFSP